MIKNGSQVTYEVRGESFLVRVGGEIDHHSAVTVRTSIDERLRAERPRRVLLELSAVDFMDSSVYEFLKPPTSPKNTSSPPLTVLSISGITRASTTASSPIRASYTSIPRRAT